MIINNIYLNIMMCKKCLITPYTLNNITKYCSSCEDVIIDDHPVYNLTEELYYYYDNIDY